MHKYDPDSPTGAQLTVGAIARLGDAAAQAKATFAKFDDALTDIEQRIERLEKQSADDAITKAAIVR